MAQQRKVDAEGRVSREVGKLLYRVQRKPFVPIRHENIPVFKEYIMCFDFEFRHQEKYGVMDGE